MGSVLRRWSVVLVVAALAVSACAGSDEDDGEADDGDGETSTVSVGTGDGYVDEEWLRGRQDDYLAFATTELDPTSITNVIAHAERARRDDSFEFDGAAVTPETFREPLEEIAGWVDTTDFDVLYLMNLYYGYRDSLPPELVQALEDAFTGFEYWYTEPTPAGIIDNKYYWSENHRIIFHTDEYLAGEALPDAEFRDGRTGAEHRDEARERILTWIDEKARFGFTEWHSDVYYQKDVTPLLTLVEFADDEEIRTRAAMLLDLVLFDLALHLHDGNFGATHGRSYMKDKSIATDQDVFGVAKLLFDDTSLPYVSRGDAGAVLMARAQRYRMPEVLRRVAASEEPMIDREHMNVPLDPLAPVTADPEAPYGYDFDDPDNVGFWWERGAQTVWPVVPLTLDTLDEYGLWESQFFSPFKPLADAVGDDRVAAQELAQTVAPMLAFALLSEVDTYTYRTRDVMLSSAQNHRPGQFGDQHHAWQATLDAEALVFTTHPKNEPFQGADSWPDGDGYWTGSGSLPRSAQRGSAAIHAYAPIFASPGAGPFEAFSYLPYTHAWFPTERFDEVVRDGGWTFGRTGDAYVGLWSWRAPEWRDHDPANVYTSGLTEPFDLVAPGGADNVWIVEVGGASTNESFTSFRERLLAATIDVTPAPPDEAGIAGGFTVRYESPAEGEMVLDADGTFEVDGEEMELRGDQRYDNPWSTIGFDSLDYQITDDDGGLVLDFTAGTREARRGRDD